ncbi:MAG: sulfite exporter TauE/SafE family protein, partial [Calditrichaeota bacterium]
IIGGTVSGITGSGLDIVTFSLLVLAFRLNEKVATPTSVVLMGMNALAGFLYKQGFSVGMAESAWNYWYVCIPIVVIGAPAGARFIRNRSRLFVAGFLYFSIVVQYIAAIIIIPMSRMLVFFSLAVLTFGIVLFWQMSKMGEQRLAWLKSLELKAQEVPH